MGRTFPNVDAVRVTRAGYYFNPKLMKLARLSVGEKLPHHVGPWEFVAAEHELSSSEVVAALRHERPDLDFRKLTYTVRSPLERRFPIGPSPQLLLARYALVALVALAVGAVVGSLRRRHL
jgi:hypothetical protein